MWQFVLAKVSVEGWVIDPDKHGLLDGPGDTLGLPTHDGKIVQFNGETCGVGNAIDRGGVLKSSLYLSQKVLPVSPMYSTVHPR